MPCEISEQEKIGKSMDNLLSFSGTLYASLLALLSRRLAMVDFRKSRLPSTYFRYRVTEPSQPKNADFVLVFRPRPREATRARNSTKCNLQPPYAQPLGRRRARASHRKRDPRGKLPCPVLPRPHPFPLSLHLAAHIRNRLNSLESGLRIICLGAPIPRVRKLPRVYGYCARGTPKNNHSCVPSSLVLFYGGGQSICGIV